MRKIRIHKVWKTLKVCTEHSYYLLSLRDNLFKFLLKLIELFASSRLFTSRVQTLSSLLVYKNPLFLNPFHLYLLLNIKTYLFLAYKMIVGLDLDYPKLISHWITIQQFCIQKWSFEYVLSSLFATHFRINLKSMHFNKIICWRGIWT